MLTGVITDPLKELPIFLQTEGVKALEFRLDLIENLDSIAQLPAEMTTIFTARTEAHLELLSLNPTYVDLPWDCDYALIDLVRRKFPQVKILLSYHNFEETPEHLGQLVHVIRMRGGDCVKLACMAISTLDSLRMLKLVQSEYNIAGMCMGEFGQITRILGQATGNLFTYAPLTQSAATAPGQLPIETLTTLYRSHMHTDTTRIYGLIGNPVKQSIGHLCHNAIFENLGEDAVYVKMALKKEETREFFELIESLPIYGLSVTMPLKERVMSTAAVNTLKRTQAGWIRENTDADGAMDAIEERFSLQGKTVAIIGTGGAAKALCIGAKKRGAKVRLLSRNSEKGEELEALAKVEVDLIINATPASMPISSDALKPETTVFDINYNPMETELIKAAKAKGCPVIYGYEMFRGQALKQQEIWLEKPLEKTVFDKAFFLRFLCSDGEDLRDVLNSDNKSLSLSH